MQLMIMSQISQALFNDTTSRLLDTQQTKFSSHEGHTWVENKQRDQDHQAETYPKFFLVTFNVYDNIRSTGEYQTRTQDSYVSLHGYVLVWCMQTK